MADRLFTLDEAHAALDDLRPVAERMVDLRRHHVEAIDRRDGLGERIGSNGGGLGSADVAEADREIEQLTAALESCIDRLLEAGVQVEDVDEGLLDFPTLRGAQEALLCWRVGEGAIAHWHGADEGFAGRKPVGSGE